MIDVGSQQEIARRFLLWRSENDYPGVISRPVTNS